MAEQNSYAPLAAASRKALGPHTEPGFKFAWEPTADPMTTEAVAVWPGGHRHTRLRLDKAGGARIWSVYDITSGDPEYIGDIRSDGHYWFSCDRQCRVFTSLDLDSRETALAAVLTERRDGWRKRVDEDMARVPGMSFGETLKFLAEYTSREFGDEIQRGELTVDQVRAYADKKLTEARAQK